MSAAREQQRERQRQFMPYLFVLPVLIYYALFWMGPVLGAVAGSLRGAGGELTLQNYVRVFTDPVFPIAARNTLIIVAVSVTLEFAAALALALLINTRFRGSGVLLAVALIPMALPAVAVGAMWSSGFATYGWLNSLLRHLRLLGPETRIAFLAGGPWESMLLIILIDAWQVIPFMMVILLAGLQNQRRELVEAGYVFGASRWVALRRIVMPLLKPTIQTALLLRIISAIQIWLIIVMLYGYRRLPVLLEELVYYQEVMTGEEYYRMALAYSVIVAAVISAVAILYLRISERRAAGGRANR